MSNDDSNHPPPPPDGTDLSGRLQSALDMLQKIERNMGDVSIRLQNIHGDMVVRDFTRRGILPRPDDFGKKEE